MADIKKPGLETARQQRQPETNPVLPKAPDYEPATGNREVMKSFRIVQAEQLARFL
jgi:hypothetical protein